MMKAIKLANKKLEKFLRERRVYQKFIKNATRKKIGGVGKELLSTMAELRISESFMFHLSKDGNKFWYDLHDKFLKTK